MNPPCYNRETHTDCPKRRVGCRSTCEEWQKFEAANADERERRYMANKDSYRVLPLRQRRQKQQMLNRNKR